MMSAKGKTLILLFVWWPVNNLHRLLNNTPAQMLHLFPFAPTCTEDIQWHVHSICESISYLCIFIGIRLYIGQLRNRQIAIDQVIDLIIILQIVDLIHYLGWHRRSEIILTLEGLMFIACALRIFIKYTHGQTGKT